MALEQGSAQLFSYPGRYFRGFERMEPSPVEALVAQFCVRGQPPRDVLDSFSRR
jgi:hypothetical protein